MNKPTILSQIDVAARCTSSWDKMEGDEQVRFCHECKLNVYNLSSMSEADAEALIMKKEGRLCVRFYRRNDGTILTDNCPVGLRRIRNFGRKVAAVFAVVISYLLTSGNQLSLAEEKKCPDKAKSQELGPPTMGEYMPQPLDIYKENLLEQIGQGWHEKGGPVLNLQIGKDGAVQAVTVTTSCGTTAIDDAAVQTIRNMKFAALPSTAGDSLTLPIDLSGANKDK